MSNKLKVEVIVGKIANPGFLDTFQFIGNQCETTIHIIDNPPVIGSYRSSVKMKVYPDIKDMTGYMRGLENELQDADIIIAAENYNLSTFQAVRTASKYDKPVIVMSQQDTIFLAEDAPNIKAIQCDTNSHADLFLYCNKLVKASLLAEGVDASKLESLPAAVDTTKFFPLEERRKKFRQYAGIAEDELIILFHENLERENHPFDLLDILRLLKQRSPDLFSKTKIILVGNGEATNELKYAAVDHGLGSKLLFIHQDPLPFSADLYCASDILVIYKKFPNKSMIDRRWILEAAACGVIPLVVMGTEEAEWLDDSGYILEYDNISSVTLAVEKALKNDLPAQKLAVAAMIKNRFDSKIVGKDLVKYITKTLAGHSSANRGVRFQERISAIEDGLKQKRNPLDLYVMIEELLLIADQNPIVRSEALRLKGDLLIHQSKTDEAMECYGECTQLNPKNINGFLGLGNIAYMNHANEDALTFFKKGLALDPNNADMLLRMGLLHRRAGLNNESIYWLGKSLCIDHHNPKALVALTQACLECPSTHESIAILEKTRELAGDHPSVLLTLGQLYIRSGNTELGKALLSEVLDKETKTTSEQKFGPHLAS